LDRDENEGLALALLGHHRRRRRRRRRRRNHGVVSRSLLDGRVIGRATMARRAITTKSSIVPSSLAAAVGRKLS
jgi:hypothetical protein